MHKDKIENIANSLIQHGKSSDRIYLMKLDRSDVQTIIPKLDALARENQYTKIFAKVPEDLANKFLENGYRQEARVPKFFKGVTGCMFLGKFFSQDREQNQDTAEIQKILDLAVKKSQDTDPQAYGYEISQAGREDVEQMSQVYKKVFASYPFAIDNPDYLLETMKSHVKYYTVRNKNEIIAVSSSEIDREAENAEMTDFATLPEYRGQNLGLLLLRQMESDMKLEGIKTVYTISRALSYGINITFAKNNYYFAGTLTKNTNISGSIESMNVWYKHLV